MSKNLYGLIGYPVKHSLSAFMQNTAFKHLDIDAEYSLFEVKPEGLKDFFSDFRKKGLLGINITIPHKTRSLYFMDDLSAEASLVEAINTVVLKGGRLVGYNTDGIGFIESLKKDMGFDPKGKSVFIFGAGGAGRAVSFSLAREGAHDIVVADVDFDRAAGLARDVEKKTDVEMTAVEHKKDAVRELILNCDLLVNATPCGMKKEDPELAPIEFLHKDLAVFDLIYNPRQTSLIKAALKKSLKAISGLGMLVYQGAASFELWTGKKAPLDVMRKAVECHL